MVHLNDDGAFQDCLVFVDLDSFDYVWYEVQLVCVLNAFFAVIIEGNFIRLAKRHLEALVLLREDDIVELLHFGVYFLGNEEQSLV